MTSSGQQCQSECSELTHLMSAAVLFFTLHNLYPIISHGAFLANQCDCFLKILEVTMEKYNGVFFFFDGDS